MTGGKMKGCIKNDRPREAGTDEMEDEKDKT